VEGVLSDAWRRIYSAKAVRCNRVSGVNAPLALEDHMGGFLRRNELNAFVSQRAHVDPFEQPLARAQQDGRNGDVQLIDQAPAKILLDDADRSAAQTNILALAASRARASAA
jgi:hypothetical protein